MPIPASVSAPASSQTPAELRELGASISRLTARLRKTPGLSEGHVERVATAIERILRDYGGASYRQYRNLVRDCDDVAAEIAKLQKEEALWPRFTKVLDAALLRIRKRDLYAGRQLVGKLGKLRAQGRERDAQLAEYREGYKAIERDIARLKAERDRLRSVRKPPASEADVERVKGHLEAANRTLAHAVIAELHSVPSRLALPAFLEGSKDRRLLLPPIPEADAAPLLGLLETVGPVREVFGDRGVHSLLEALGYSDAKLAHLLGDGRPLKAVLNANLPWLKAVTAPGSLLPLLSLDEPLEELRGRLEALTVFAGRMHAASEARDRLAEVARSAASGEIGKAQEADRLYRTFGDATRKAWEGTLEAAIKETEAGLAARTKDLAGLTPPDKLA